MSKKNKIKLGLITLTTTGIAVIGATAGVVSGLQHSTSIVDNNQTVVDNNDNNNINGGNINNGPTVDNGNSQVNTDVKLEQKQGIVKSGNLVFSAVLNSDMMSKTKTMSAKTTIQSGTKEIKLTNSITPDHTAGYVDRVMENGTTQKRYLSPEYYNNRTFMPILDVEQTFPSERDNAAYRANEYYGWTKKVTSSTTTEIKMTYNASETLKKTYPKAQQVINASEFDLSRPDAFSLVNDTTSEFVKLSGINESTDLSKIHLPETVKKLTLDGERNNLEGLTIPNTVQELEIYLGKGFTAVDPLVFPKTTNIIWDTNISNASLFKEIKIGEANGKTMTNESKELQNAINDVYQLRIHERAFQGVISGGYIGSWDLTNTKVTSFNKVKVPVLEDGTGRFYIAHVEIKTDGNIDPSINESIENDAVSNDAQIGDWFDWGKGWQKVQEVKVTSSKPISLDVAAKEVIGFMKKYSNVEVIDLTGIILKGDKTHDELADAVKKLIPEVFGKESDRMNIQLKTNSTQLLG